MTPLIEARHVTKTFGGGLLDHDRTIALENFSLTIDVERPSITAIVGESGSGKTTLARLLLGLVAPTSGQVLYQGRDLHALSGAEHRGFRRDVQARADPNARQRPLLGKSLADLAQNRHRPLGPLRAHTPRIGEREVTDVRGIGRGGA